jgi:DNA invertase Pin-like site-specific DNA recombinase
MLQAIRAGEYEAIVCFRFDRLGRNVRDLLELFAELENRNVEVISVNENLDTTTPIGRAMRGFILQLAQLERESISEATKQRLAALKANGMKLGRPAGSKDTKPRRKSGYLLRWAGSRAKKAYLSSNPPTCLAEEGVVV